MLHGDIKSKNIMVDILSGKFYLIDFGQSVAVRTMTDKTREQFENLQDEECNQIQICIRAALADAPSKQPLSTDNYCALNAGATTGVVPLLRATAAGERYEVLIYVDDSDRVFNFHKDMLVVAADGSPVGSAFNAQ